MMPKKKKPKKVQRHQRGKGGVAGSAGDAPAGGDAENKKHAKKDKHKASLGKLLADADQG